MIPLETPLPLSSFLDCDTREILHAPSPPRTLWSSFTLFFSFFFVFLANGKRRTSVAPIFLWNAAFVVRCTRCNVATTTRARCTRAFPRKRRNYAAFGRRPFANCSYVRLFSVFSRYDDTTSFFETAKLRDVADTAIFEGENDPPDARLADETSLFSLVSSKGCFKIIA